MFTLRRALERGRSQSNWLDSWHTFSFDQYHDPNHMSFGPLRVINEDTISGGEGFGMHPHRDMEIITYVIEGRLRHEDNMGNGSVIVPGEIQKMSAGTGVWHSEFNASQADPVHLLQIWIVPDKPGLQPSYEQQKFELKPGVWKLLGSPAGDGVVSIQQSVKLYAVSIDRDSVVAFTPAKDSKLWVQLVKGSCTVGSADLHQGDGLAISTDAECQVIAKESTELLLFELLRK